jgi:hypothetical protein
VRVRVLHCAEHLKIQHEAFAQREAADRSIH